MMENVSWLAAHERSINATLAVLAALAFAVVALVDLRTWLALRNQHDRTDVGRALRRKKLAQGAAEAMMALLYIITVMDLTTHLDVNLWYRLGYRGLAVIGLVGAAWQGIRFVRAMARENWGQPNENGGR